MHLLLSVMLLLATVQTTFASSDDLTCVSRNVQDAGYYLVANMTNQNSMTVRIEAINHWTGNKLEYSQESEVVSMLEDGVCISVIVDDSNNPETVVVVSTPEAPTIEKLNGVTSIKFADLYCESSARLIEMMKCHVSK
ncbi:MAG: hypothetical protein AABZ31_02285 [Bdellovibrionota bacterium]